MDALVELEVGSSTSNQESKSSSATLESLPGLFNSCKNGIEEGYHHEYYFSEMSHALRILRGLNKQRKSSLLCDVVICIQGWHFPCHRNVLAACSPYFLAMFTGEMRESMEQQVTIVGVEPEIMKQLIDYAYTSDITITQENAQHLLSAANMVQMLAVQEACCKFLESEMDPTNCLGIHCFAEAHMCTPLSEKARKYTLEHFAEVVQFEELLNLSEDKLIELICNDELNVACEDLVFQALIDWVKHDEKKRLKSLPNIMQYIRLPFVDPYFLFDKVEEEPFLVEHPQCRLLIDEAKKYLALKDREAELQSPRTKPRKSQSQTQLLITSGGEIYNKNYLSSVDCYNLTESRWMRLKELPFPRCHHGIAVSNRSDIYIAGGFNKDKVVLNNVLRFEIRLDKWIKVACMLTPRARHGMASLDGYIYAVGGYDGRSRIDTVERYNTIENRWTYVASMGVALSRCEAVGAHGYLYVAGGTTEPNNQCVDIMQRYNPRSNTWERLAPLPCPRCLGSLVMAMGQIYAVGGTEEMVRASKSLTRYNPKNNTWTQLAQLQESRFDAGVAVIGDRIFVVSGHDGENSFFNTVEEYDVNLDQWKTWSSTVLPYGRCRFGCIGIAIAD